MPTAKRRTTVHVLEVADGEHVWQDRFNDPAQHAELWAQGAAVLLAELKGVLAGKLGIFGRDTILAMVDKVMSEDDLPDRPQTIPYDDYEDGVPAGAAAPFRKSSPHAAP